jgi:2-aminoadipate transaminase
MQPQVGIIDFAIGQPDPTLLPYELVRETAVNFPRYLHREHLQYGAESGDPHFLQELSFFLSDQYNYFVPADELLVTNGVSQGLDLICTLYTNPGDTIFVEQPTYHLALKLFADHQLHVVGVPMDAEGVDIAAFTEMLSRHQPVFFYTIPVFHNPTGRTLSLTRREKLVALSREHNFLIVADEVYQALNFSVQPPPPLASFIHSGQVISLGSFSKILAPGLRLGWLQTTPERRRQIEQAGLLQSGGGLNPFTAAIVGGWLQQGAQSAYLQRLKTVYRERAAALSAACRQQLHDFGDFHEPGGGFFLWFELAEGVEMGALQDLAADFSVNFHPQNRFMVASTGDQTGMRLCFAYYAPGVLAAGVSRLAEVLHAY